MVRQDSMQHFIRYRTYRTIEEAEAIAAFLNENFIKTTIEKNDTALGDFIIGSTIDNKVELKIAADDFKTADELLLAMAEESIDELDDDYYLFSFSDWELIEIISKPDEWSELDFVFAKQILNRRGVEFSPKEIEKLKKKRLEEISSEDKSGATWIIAGIILLIIYLIKLKPFLGALSILSNAVLWRAKKILPDGRKVPLYDKKTSRIAMILFYLSLAIVIVTSVLIMTNNHFLDSYYIRF